MFLGWLGCAFRIPLRLGDAFKSLSEAGNACLKIKSNSNSNSNIILQHIQYNVINNLNIWYIM